MHLLEDLVSLGLDDDGTSARGTEERLAHPTIMPFAPV
jgi:hypothetical protein